MIYMWFTGKNDHNLAVGVEKDRDSIFTAIWKPGFKYKQRNAAMSLIIHV
jgi:hypothetical protein